MKEFSKVLILGAVLALPMSLSANGLDEDYAAYKYSVDLTLKNGDTVHLEGSCRSLRRQIKKYKRDGLLKKNGVGKILLIPSSTTLNPSR